MSGSGGNRAPQQHLHSGEVTGAGVQTTTAEINSSRDKISASVQVEDSSPTDVSTRSPVGYKTTPQSRPDLRSGVSPVLFPFVAKISGCKTSDSNNAMADRRPPPDGDVRTWFANLSTGKERASALAIVDDDILRQFSELATVVAISHDNVDSPSVLGPALTSPRHRAGGSEGIYGSDMSKGEISVDNSCSAVRKGEVEHIIVSSPAAPPSVNNNGNESQDKTLMRNNLEDNGIDTPPGETLPSTAYRIRNSPEQQEGAVSGGVKMTAEKGVAADISSPRIVSAASTYEGDESDSLLGSINNNSPKVVTPDSREHVKERKEHTEGGEKEIESAGTTTILHFESGLTIVLKAGRTSVEEADKAEGNSLEKSDAGGLDKKEKGRPERAVIANDESVEKTNKKRAKAIAVAESKRTAAQALKSNDRLAKASAFDACLKGADSETALMDKVRLVFCSTLEQCRNAESPNCKEGDFCEDERKVGKDSTAIITMDPDFLNGVECKDFFFLASNILQAERRKVYKSETKNSKVCASEYMSSKVPLNDGITDEHLEEWAHSKPSWWVSLFGKGDVDKSKLSSALILLLGMELAVRQSYLCSVLGNVSKNADSDHMAASGVDAKRSMDIVLSPTYGIKGTSSAQVNMASFVPSLNLPHPDGEEGSSTEPWATPPEEEGENDEEENNADHDEFLEGEIVGSMASMRAPTNLTKARTIPKSDIAIPRTDSSLASLNNFASTANGNCTELNASLHTLFDLCSHLRKCRGMINEAATQELMKEYIASSGSNPETAGKSSSKGMCQTQTHLENLLVAPLSWYLLSCSKIGKKNETTGLDQVHLWAQSWNNDILPVVLDRLAGFLAKHPEIFTAEKTEKLIESHSSPSLDHSSDCQASDTTYTASKQQGEASGKDLSQKTALPAEAVSQSQVSPTMKKKRKKNKKKKRKAASSTTDKVKQTPNTTDKDEDGADGNTKNDSIAAVSVGASEEGVERCGSSKTMPTSSRGTSGVSSESSPIDQDTKSSPKEEVINTSSQSLPRTNSNITISRVDGVGATCVVVEQLGRRGDDEKELSSTNSACKAGDENGDKHDDEADGDGSAWEKVSTKSRGGRNRKSGGTGSGRGHGKSAQSSSAAFPDRHSGGNSQSFTDTQQTRKSKGRNKASRQRVIHRKMARDIVNQILENVEDEATGKRKLAAKAFLEERRKANRLTALAEQKQRSASMPCLLASGTSNTAGAQLRSAGASLRDVVVGGATGVTTTGADSKQSAKQTLPKGPRALERSKVPPQARKGMTSASASASASPSSLAAASSLAASSLAASSLAASSLAAASSPSNRRDKFPRNF
mmetsp:Transcript_10250/g.15141  ORF Transcript_10250/g.15141 Transcript_10250/m.15141 type:complete len:1330 (-) Transcript_10250:226-4215(-)